MLDPSWAVTRPLLWLALAGLLVLLVVRSIRKDRREYQRFKRYRTTAKRQAMFRKWLLGAFLSFGGLSVALLLLAGAFVGPLLQELTAWPGIRDIRGGLAHQDGLVTGTIVGLVLAIVVLTAVGIVAARKEKSPLASVGDIAAMLPRNRQELRLGAIMSINAGVFEELLFRLALPALVYGATGSAIVAVLFSVLLFGGLHVYQGVAGVVGTTVVGALMMGAYAISGTVIVPIVLHALVNLRSLVLLPVAVQGVHRIDGDKHPLVPKQAPPKPAPPEPAASPADPL